MAEDVRSLDVTHAPELLAVAEEVANSGVPRVLKRDGEELAVVRPVTPGAEKRARAHRRSSVNAWLESLIGIAESDGPSDVSENVHGYIATR